MNCSKAAAQFHQQLCAIFRVNWGLSQIDCKALASLALHFDA
jgi:hypothetical protein